MHVSFVGRVELRAAGRTADPAARIPSEGLTRESLRTVGVTRSTHHRGPAPGSARRLIDAVDHKRTKVTDR